MHWIRRGKIDLDFSEPWQKNGIITPHPLLLNDNAIRIFSGFRDNQGISRVGYIDVIESDPKKIIFTSKKPVLNVGNDGCFDDNGIIIGDVFFKDDTLYMFYIGFQQVKKAKFLAFTGLAASTDNGLTFERVSKSPILDRSDNSTTIRAIHSCNKIDNKIICYYAVGSEWEYIGGTPYPKYEIYSSEFNWNDFSFFNEQKCISVVGDEYRIGKPTVYEVKDGFIMLYTKGKKTDLNYYMPGIAYSEDGTNWIRKDEMLNFHQGTESWENISISYPKLIKDSNNKIYMFYSGNAMGAGGLGFAELKI